MSTHLFRSDWVLPYSPAVAEAIRQLEDRQDKLSLGRSSLLEASLQGHVLDRCRIRRCC